MKCVRVVLPLLMAVSGLAASGRAEETVTITKKRLSELEQKAAEAEKLKGALQAAQEEIQRLKNKRLPDAPAATRPSAPESKAAPEVKHLSPPMTSLAPLKKEELILALDLSNHYQSDPAAADQRYKNRLFRLQGEVIGFDKPMFVNNYRIQLKTGDPRWRITCDVEPPPEYRAVFPVQNGTALVAAFASGRRSTLTRLGEIVVLRGRCKGVEGSGISFSRCEFLGK